MGRFLAAHAQSLLDSRAQASDTESFPSSRQQITNLTEAPGILHSPFKIGEVALNRKQACSLRIRIESLLSNSSMKRVAVLKKLGLYLIFVNKIPTIRIQPPIVLLLGNTT
jgi:hypothetical protein